MAATNKSKNAAKKKATPKVEPEVDSSEWRRHYGNSMAEGFGVLTVIAIAAGVYKLGAVVINALSSPKAQAED